MNATLYTLVWIFTGPVFFGSGVIKDQQINFTNRLTGSDCAEMAFRMNDAFASQGGDGLTNSRVICVAVTR